MKRRFWKQSLSLALTFALILAMPCVTSVWAGGDVTYWEGRWNETANTVEWKTETKEEGTYTKITSDNLPTTWSESWYVAEGEVTIGTEDSPQRVTVTGDVHLILKDNCNLTVNGGIQVAQGNSLTIYAQSKDDDGLPTASTGRLTAQNVAAHTAGIGGNDGATGGAITISGGTITASSNRVGDASIRSDTITISGGTVNTRNDSTNGIGISSDTITISGGTVNASASGYHGVAINGSKISISGGTVDASTYGYGGVAISGGTITISGGTVTASAENTSGTGISSDTISISGGTVNASTYGNGGVAINGSTISISGGTVNANSTGSLSIAIQVTGGSTLTISGGTVTASSNMGRAIGYAGDEGCGTIKISGGTVEAKTIGYKTGDGAYKNEITISGGTVKTDSIIGDFSTGEDGHAVIYAADQIYCNDKGHSQNSWRGIIFENNIGTVYGNQTLQEDLTILGSGTKYIVDSLTIRENTSLTVPEGKTLTVDDSTLNVNSGGTLTVESGGTLNVNSGGTVSNSGTIESWGTVEGSAAVIDGTTEPGTFIQHAAGIQINPDSVSLTAGDATELTVTLKPEYATTGVSWESSDPSVAAVEADENDNTKATVTARKAGTATITVTSKDDSEIIASCTVTVEKKSTRYRLPDAFSQPFGCESDTLGLVDVDGAYQFRFTSEFGTPPVVEIDSESFRAELASQEGNDYFWKIYAIGSAGETCNVTVNGTCVARLTAVSAAPASGLVVSDTTAPFTVAAGGSYQFRLTADAMPSMAAGSPCFTVEYVGNDGKDWFFKVYAIGNVGDACGFYVNLAPTPVAIATIA